MEIATEKSSLFDEFVRNIVIFYLILILIGYLSNFFYYIQFKINISNYFTIEDYLNSFFSDLPALLVVCIFYLVFYISKYGQLLKLEGEIEAITKDKNYLTPFYYQLIKKNVKGFKSVFITTIILSAIFLFLLIFTKLKLFFLLLIISICLICFSGIFTFISYLSDSNLVKFNIIKAYIIAGTFSLVLTIQLIEGAIEGFFILHPTVNSAKITLDFNTGKSINTSDSILYLGVTKDYVFLYDKLNQKTFIYNRSTLTSIETEFKPKK